MNSDPDGSIQVLFSAEAIAGRVEDLGREIAARISDDLMVVAILKGSFMFTADLLRALHRSGVKPRIDFLTLSSYGSGTESSGEVAILRDITDPVEGRHVLLVDDILESGRTLAFAKSLLYERGAADVKVCILLDKAGKRETELDAEFLGFDCPDRFVVGYGLDYAHRYRELPFIGYLRQP